MLKFDVYKMSGLVISIRQKNLPKSVKKVFIRERNCLLKALNIEKLF